MGLPVAFMGGIAAMAALGYSINMLTMVGLLMVVGLLMDDAIVISENIATHREKGAPPMDAAVRGAREVMPGVLSSFMTTLCVFGSLAFVEGNIGQLLSVIPVVMIAVLAVSLVEAFFILPSHLGHALTRASGKPGRIQSYSGRILDQVRDNFVAPFAKTCTEARYLTTGVAICALLLAITAIAGGVLKFSAFPELDGDTLEARILMPQGTPLERTRQVVARIESAIEAIDARLTPDQPGQSPLVVNRTVRFNENADAYESGPHVATVSIDVLTSEQRTVNNEELLGLWREEIGAVPDLIALKFTEPTIGPAGRAIDIRLVGDDLAGLKAASEDLQRWLNLYRGVVGLTDDTRLGKPEIKIRIKEEGTALGLRAEDVADQLRSAYFGTTVDEIQVGPQSFEIDARMARSDRDNLGSLDNFVVATSDGALVPLSAIATLERDRGYAPHQPH